LHTGEWYEDPTLFLYQCSGFEDPNCNAQWGTQLGLDKAVDKGNYPFTVYVLMVCICR